MPQNGSIIIILKLLEYPPDLPLKYQSPVFQIFPFVIFCTQEPVLWNILFSAILYSSISVPKYFLLLYQEPVLLKSLLFSFFYQAPVFWKYYILYLVLFFRQFFLFSVLVLSTSDLVFYTWLLIFVHLSFSIFILYQWINPDILQYCHYVFRLYRNQYFKRFHKKINTYYIIRWE